MSLPLAILVVIGGFAAIILLLGALLVLPSEFLVVPGMALCMFGLLAGMVTLVMGMPDFPTWIKVVAGTGLGLCVLALPGLATEA